MVINVAVIVMELRATTFAELFVTINVRFQHSVGFFSLLATIGVVLKCDTKRN